MSITLGIYDVFSYALPGILYIYMFNEVLKLYHQTALNLTPFNNNVYDGIVMVLFAYLIGHLFDHISHDLWYRRFYPGKSEARAYTRFKSLPGVKAEFEPMQWPILLSILRHNDLELCNSIDKNKATSIMLRNVSFALALLTLVEVIYIFSNAYLLASGLIAIASLIGCLVALRRSDSFNMQFYILIYQQALVYGSNLDEVLENNRPKKMKSEKPTRKSEKRD